MGIRPDRGFTLIEVLVGLALTSIVSMAIYSIFSTQHKIFMTQKQIAEIQQNLRTCLYLLDDNIKMACFDPLGTASPKILDAGRDSFRFQADLNENGHFFDPDPDQEGFSAKSGEDPNETLCFELSKTSGNGVRSLVRRVWSGSQSMADGIEALDFVYLDGGGKVLGPLPLTEEGREKIRSVEITLVARSELQDAAHDDRRAYKNLQGDVLIDCREKSPVNCNGSHYHRRSLSRTVYLRNVR
jgi:type IV pilus assembly protein PilW